MIGLAVLAVGVLAIPYPGPGWAIVFVGLGILATEFLWAQRLLTFAKGRYNRSIAWLLEQGLWVKVAGVVFITAVVAATMWVLGVLGRIAALLGVESAWPKSPIAVGAVIPCTDSMVRDRAHQTRWRFRDDRRRTREARSPAAGACRDHRRGSGPRCGASRTG